jgi:hypothetical protein
VVGPEEKLGVGVVPVIDTIDVGPGDVVTDTELGGLRQVVGEVACDSHGWRWIDEETMGAFCGKGGWIQSFGSSVRGVVLKESSLGLPAEGDLGPNRGARAAAG